MRFLISAIILATLFLAPFPAVASLPHYNPDVGYTIWLPKSWFEAGHNYLKWAQKVKKPVPIQGDSTNWNAGYYSPETGLGRSLLVEVKRGRRMNKTAISNFNQFVIRSLSQFSKRDALKRGFDSISFKSAKYFKKKKILRVETEMVRNARTVLNLTYIVYTRTGMLTFVGYVDPSDVQAKLAIDKAVLSLYLDDHMRY